MILDCSGGDGDVESAAAITSGVNSTRFQIYCLRFFVCRRRRQGLFFAVSYNAFYPSPLSLIHTMIYYPDVEDGGLLYET